MAPDLVELVARARDAGEQTFLFERGLRGATGLAGLGCAFQIVGDGRGARLEQPDGMLLDEEPGPPLAAAALLWKRFSRTIDGQGSPQLPATGLVAMGGFAFDLERQPTGEWSGFPSVLLRVPRLSVVRIGTRTFASALDPEAERLLDLEPGAFRAPGARRLQVAPVQEPGAWTARVQDAVGRLQAGSAAKVVLAREVIARADGAIAAGKVLEALRAAYPSCFTFLVAGDDGTALVGASPELLARRLGRQVVSQPMAGSARRGSDDAEDARLGKQLARSSKDLAEHRLVADHVARALEAVSVRVEAQHVPEVVRFANIQHLATTISSELPSLAPPGVLEVCSLLHPTPAVAGAPPRAALDLIRELEGIERGWYAGAVGWMDSNGDGEFAVALRCGLLWEDGARLYAGVGVMPDSEAAAELTETDLKFRALLEALKS